MESPPSPPMTGLPTRSSSDPEQERVEKGKEKGEEPRPPPPPPSLPRRGGEPRIYPPDQSYPPTHPLHLSNRPDQRIQGEWSIVASTLPLWRKRKNVIISYRTLPPLGDQAGSAVRFSDSIRYDSRRRERDGKKGNVKASLDLEKEKGGGGGESKGGFIKGINVLDDRGFNGASFHWKGSGLLRLFNSRWQVVGYGRYDEDQPVQPSTTKTTRPTLEGEKGEEEESGTEKAKDWDWIVTYFEKTYATPSGLDIYARDPKRMSKETYLSIVDGLKNMSSSPPPPSSTSRPDSEGSEEDDLPPSSSNLLGWRRRRSPPLSTDQRRKEKILLMSRLGSTMFEVPHD
ncbi:hypothetical protein IE53DRAFT_384987 [Violaceomyces palustris]|uniref:Uncharacterized protein n=1 Tax=Violaceomyces palustris TaxID=1673888 RepID=A0ACD0P386_9BASI|nr:hypothetical protein IE53DRAFT_384987 [Violaceomyces palustris]